MPLGLSGVALLTSYSRVIPIFDGVQPRLGGYRLEVADGRLYTTKYKYLERLQPIGTWQHTVLIDLYVCRYTVGTCNRISLSATDIAIQKPTRSQGYGVRYHSVSISGWMLWIIIFGYLSLRVKLGLRRVGMRNPSLCATCGYDIHACLSERCPKCASPIATQCRKDEARPINL